MTDRGILLVYKERTTSSFTALASLFFYRSDPRKLMSRTDERIFSPEKDWERVGQVPNVVFVEGLVQQCNRWLIYYGGADKYIGVAEAPVK
jgi:predicted GH43/DUF377 family glycosyl hydrolase